MNKEEVLAEIQKTVDACDDGSWTFPMVFKAVMAVLQYWINRND